MGAARSLLTVCLLGLGASGRSLDAAQGADATPDPDERFLSQRAKLPTDDACLLNLLRQHSNKDEDLRDLPTLIRQLGDRVFAVRERASQKLVALGLPALPALREVLKTSDLETARRARACMAQIEPTLKVYWMPAAVRLVAKRKPAGALEALLGYLPYLPDPAAEEEIYYALDDLAVTDGKLHPALLKALGDALPARRAVAACIVGRRGDAGQQALVRKLMPKDPDPWVRLRAAQGLLAAKDKTALPVLIELLGEPSVALAWQAEELLHYAAGDEAPAEKLGKLVKAEQDRCQAAWRKWHDQHQATLDLTTLNQHPRRPGLVLVRPDLKDQHCLALAGCDGKPRVLIPHDQRYQGVQWLPEGGMLAIVGTPNGWPVALERLDLQGRTVWRKEIQRKPAGGFVGSGIPRAWCYLPDGRVLLAFYQEGFSSQGTVRWRESYAAEFDWEGNPLRDFFYMGEEEAAPAKEKVPPGRPMPPAPGGAPLQLAPWQMAVKTRDDIVPANDWRIWYPSEERLWWEPELQSVVKLRTGGELRLFKAQGKIITGNSPPVTEVEGWLPSRAVELDSQQRVVWEYVGDSYMASVRCVYPLVRFGFTRPLTEAMNLDSSRWRVPQFRSPDPVVRHRGLLGLTQVQDVDEGALKVAVELLAHEQPQMRKYGARIIGNAGPRGRAMIPELVHLLSDDADTTHMEDCVQSEARRALGRVGPDAIPALLAAFTDRSGPKHKTRRGNAIYVLAQSYLGDDPRVAEAVRSAFKDEHNYMREYVAASLRFVGEKAVAFVPELGRALEDPSSFAAWSASQVLRNLGPKAKGAIPALKKAMQLKRSDKHNYCPPGELLSVLGVVGRDAPDTIPFFISYVERGEFVELAARVLGSYGKNAEAAVPVLIAAFKKTQGEDQEHARQVFATALGDIGPAAKPAVPELMKWVVIRSDKLRTDGLVYAKALEKIDPDAGKQAMELYRKHLHTFFPPPPNLDRVEQELRRIRQSLEKQPAPGM